MKTTVLWILSASAATAVVAGGAFAQTDGTFLLVSTNTVSPATPTTTIEIWATWDAPANLTQFGVADYDITAGDGIFSNPTNILLGPGSSAGVAKGNTITGGINGSFWFPFQKYPPESPTLLASYAWTTTDFTPRMVGLLTSNTTVFIVAFISNGQAVELFPDEFTPGSGVINVVPASASWLIAGLVFVAGARRTRI